MLALRKLRSFLWKIVPSATQLLLGSARSSLERHLWETNRFDLGNMENMMSLFNKDLTKDHNSLERLGALKTLIGSCSNIQWLQVYFIHFVQFWVIICKCYNIDKSIETHTNCKFLYLKEKHFQAIHKSLSISQLI